MKTILKGAVAAALLASVSAPAFAQSVDVLTVDLERIYAESAAGKNGQAQLQGRYQTPNQQAQTAFNAARASYESQVQAVQKALGPNADASKLTPVQRTQLSQAQDRVEAARDQVVQVQQAVQASAEYVRNQINLKVVGIAEQVRAEKKAGVVLVKGQTLASDPANDITSVILPRLDAAMTTVQVVPPQTAPGAPAAAAPAATTPAKPAGSGR